MHTSYSLSKVSKSILGRMEALKWERRVWGQVRQTQGSVDLGGELLGRIESYRHSGNLALRMEAEVKDGRGGRVSAVSISLHRHYQW